jgi:hypothetical protein
VGDTNILKALGLGHDYVETNMDVHQNDKETTDGINKDTGLVVKQNSLDSYIETLKANGTTLEGTLNFYRQDDGKLGFNDKTNATGIFLNASTNKDSEQLLNTFFHEIAHNQGISSETGADLAASIGSGSWAISNFFGGQSFETNLSGQAAFSVVVKPTITTTGLGDVSLASDILANVFNAQYNDGNKDLIESNKNIFDAGNVVADSVAFGDRQYSNDTVLGQMWINAIGIGSLKKDVNIIFDQNVKVVSEAVGATGYIAKNLGIGLVQTMGSMLGSDEFGYGNQNFMDSNYGTAALFYLKGALYTVSGVFSVGSIAFTKIGMAKALEQELMTYASMLDYKTGVNATVVYSGVGNRALATKLANADNYMTIDQTVGGQALTATLNKVGIKNTDKFWEIASEKFVKQASGVVHAVVEGAKDNRIYKRVELGELMNNNDVTRIIFYKTSELLKRFPSVK